MVIRDLFFSNDVKPTPAEALNTAGISDRFTAAIFDFLIFSPVVSLLIAGFLREIKTYLILDSHSPEAAVIWVIFLGSGFLLTLFLQSLFLYFGGATPGQRFMHLQVISFPHNKKLSFAQCLLRSGLGLCGLLFFGIPYLEIVSHPLRRAFHERASDTLVISLQRKKQLSPLSVETRFVELILRSSFLLFLGTGLIFGAREYQGAKEGLFAKTADAQNLFCSDVAISEVEETPAERLDRALALFLTDEITADCLEKEADRALWSAPTEEQTWAYLAKGIVNSDSKIQSEYFDKVCAAPGKTEACAVAQYLAEDEAKARFDFKGPQSASGRVLALDQQLADRNFTAALGEIKDLRELEFLKDHLEKSFVRVVWSLNQAKDKSRSPASVQEDGSPRTEALKEFKEKYGVE